MALGENGTVSCKVDANESTDWKNQQTECVIFTLSKKEVHFNFFFFFLISGIIQSRQV